MREVHTFLCVLRCYEHKPFPVPLVNFEIFCMSTDTFVFIRGLVDDPVTFISAFKYESGVTPFTKTWIPVSVSFGYLAVIWCLHQFMKPRQKMELRTLSIIHNFNMFAISLVLFLGQLYGLIKIGLDAGSVHDFAEALLCDNKAKYVSRGTLYFWIYLFYLSKFYELVDTVIIVLRKGQLRFVHIYHHWITMLLCFVCLECRLPVQFIATLLNALVHVPMYYYYMMSSMKIEVWWKRYLTMMQIIQFVIVNVVHLGAFAWHFLYTHNCTGFDTWGNHFGLAVITSYLILFLQFYAETYTKRPQSFPKNSIQNGVNGYNSKKEE
jgi:fatty acid elongase 3